MAILSLNRCHRGLTLIEVLIALAIISIAITAVIKATGQQIRSTSYLEKKTIALWVGQNVLNEVRAKLTKLPSNGEVSKHSTLAFNRKWYWHASEERTQNQSINKIKVDVYPHETDNEDESALISLEGFVYANSTR